MIKIGFDKENPIPQDAPLAFRVYRHRPATVFATPVDEDFEVNTPEGIMKGTKGDYLVMGILGELYPLKADVFDKSYDFADEHAESEIFRDGDTLCYTPKIPEKSNALDKEE